MLDDYPSQWADRVVIPSWALIKVARNSTFDIDTAVQAAQNPRVITQIVVPIAGVLGFIATVSVLIGLCWLKTGRRGEKFGGFLRRHLPRKAQEIRHATRDSNFEIDRRTDDAHELRGDIDETSSHSRKPSLDTLKTLEPEYHFPFKNVWRNSQIVQQFRRLPDRVPWGDRAVQIRPSNPGVRFRVDPSGSSAESSGASVPNSRSGTAEGGRPDSIVKEDDDADSEYRNSFYETEETSLISPVERSENEVFLISNRQSFTISSNSSNSHQVKIVPPTPTDSSRSHGHLSPLVPPPATPLRRPPAIPPPPRIPPPVPPGPHAFRPSRLHGPAMSSQAQSIPLTQNTTPQNPTDLPLLATSSVAPQPQISAPSGPLHYHPPPARVHPTQTTTPPKLPSDVPTLPPSRRKISMEDDDHFRHTPRRPMGARLPSSSHHIARQLSLDDGLDPPIQSGEPINMISLPPRPLPSPQHTHYAPAHQRALSDETPPRLSHSRSPSIETLIPTPGDARLLYPGPVRAAGYNIMSATEILGPPGGAG
ncbi:hypothetical protein C0991_005345 [Blastosporella zonata]|nr:hypothetical protein C0991_005345 [Blastosporella zonata]